MRKFLILLCYTAILFSCTKKEKLPAGILPEKKMGDVVWDLVQAGEFLEAFVFSRDSTVDKGTAGVGWYENVFRLHGIDKPTFDKSYEYYRQHPALMKAIFDTLGKRQTPPPRASTTDSTKQDTLHYNRPFMPRPEDILDSARRGKKRFEVK
jgi:hypothetical protein